MTDINDDVTISDLDASTDDGGNSRRAALRALALGGAGAAVGVLASGRSVSAGDEGGGAVGGNAVELGVTNTSASPTIIDRTPAAAVTEGPSAFSAGGYVPASNALFPAGVGGYGDDTIPNGVHGSTTTNDGFGVVAANLSSTAADETTPQPRGLAVASANGPQIQFVVLDGAVEGPTAGPHENGELYADAVGTLWYTVDGPLDTPRFVKLAGASTAGSFHAITPSRAYDSRQTGGAYTETGQLATGASRVISLADAHDTAGNVVTADVVPAGATAAQINLTIASPSERNFASVEPGDATGTPTTSLVNWDVGVTQIANSITVQLDDDRQVRVTMGDQPGAADFIIDVFGYYL